MLNAAGRKSTQEDRGLCLVNDIPSHGSKNREKFEDIIGQSVKMQEIFTLVEKVGKATAPSSLMEKAVPGKD